ncbi:exopolysaccharide biosynthesis protein [Acetoanaerobium pronyense]|uniref:Exopolysaccharide biosynthesis protein n=1 Tax=Acetoanaerobium pronyense TaxID=1482736 RepID=A0ABS4KG15_9FIRM|nr:phosphodiester glycosidase family protein [Acetoanaerobium pronyense]MBP2026709.1 exopolysaccharide biosynthesis protein [Acetoanaerobium pronyense]
MGYKRSENKIYICVRPDSSHDRIIQSCKNLGLDFAISLDGGGSSSIKVDGSVKVSGDGRPVNNYLYVK